ncbi:MAG: substrate-binding domain-containing protein, partial [Caulobacterales bacterium]|nr:substrate-binding domain-containing protein [Caulobacterales bacterium]
MRHRRCGLRPALEPAGPRPDHGPGVHGMAEADSALVGMAAAAGRRVVVDIHPHGHLQQELLAGIAAAAREQGWDLSFLPGLGQEVAAGQPGPEGPPEGIVALSASAAAATALAGLPCSVVELGGWVARWPLPEVDEEAAGRLAALHLQERGYPRLAFLGEDAAADAGRGRGFAAAARAALAGELRLAAADLVRSRGDERIIPWLTRLPLPCGILASSDRLALALAAVAYRHGLQLPEELGIIGAGGDPLLSSLSPVPLSSVRLPLREQGQQAARLLGELMAGRPPSACSPLIPTEVVAQRSSDRREHADALVAAA